MRTANVALSLLFLTVGCRGQSAEVRALAGTVQSGAEPDATRVAAARSLGAMGARAASAAPMLTRALSDPSPAVQEAALAALLGVEDPNGLATVLEVAPKGEDRLLAVTILARKGEAGLGVLATAAQSPNPRTRSLAAVGLRSRAGTVELLAGLLSDRESSVRTTAALCLAEMGPEAAAALPTLRERLNGNEMEARKIFVLAVNTISASGEIRIDVKAGGGNLCREAATHADSPYWEPRVPVTLFPGTAPTPPLQP